MSYSFKIKDYRLIIAYNQWVSYKRQEPLTIHSMVLVECLLLIVLVLLCFIYLGPVSIVPDAASVSGFAILDYPFGFF